MTFSTIGSTSPEPPTTIAVTFPPSLDAAVSAESVPASISPDLCSTRSNEWVGDVADAKRRNEFLGIVLSVRAGRARSIVKVDTTTTRDERKLGKINP